MLQDDRIKYEMGKEVKDPMQEAIDNLMGFGFNEKQIKDIQNNTITSPIVRKYINKAEEQGAEPGAVFALFNIVAKKEEREGMKDGGEFPDLNKDGKVTYADVLVGKGVRDQKALGGLASRLARLLSRKNKLEKELMTENMSKANQNKTSKEIDRLQKEIDEGVSSEAGADLQREMSEVASKLKAKGFSDDRIDELLEEAFENRNYSELEEALYRTSKQEGGLLENDREQFFLGGIFKKLFKDLDVNDVDYSGFSGLFRGIKKPKEYTDYTGGGIFPSILKKRKEYEEGGSIDDQMMMVITPPIKSEIEPDGEMEDNYTRFIMEEALTEEEEEMLMSKLEQDEELSMLFDKVIDVAQEFAGSGPVEGPGSGVSDSIPARLSDGEFVFTAKATEQIGADELMRMMKDAEAKADERQGMRMGGTMLDEDSQVDQYGRPLDSEIAEEELKKSMLSVNPRFK